MGRPAQFSLAELETRQSTKLTKTEIYLEEEIAFVSLSCCTRLGHGFREQVLNKLVAVGLTTGPSLVLSGVVLLAGGINRHVKYMFEAQ